MTRLSEGHHVPKSSPEPQKTLNCRSPRLLRPAEAHDLQVRLSQTPALRFLIMNRSIMGLRDRSVPLAAARILLSIAMGNLFAHRLKTLVMGVILLFSALL